MAERTEAVKAKIDALKKRIEPEAKTGDLVAIARELEDLGGELAREESREVAGAVWPRDMNEPPVRAKEWGEDPREEPSGG